MVVVQMHGVPGSGKSTIARALAPLIDAVVLDKDVIKAALLRSGLTEAQAAPAAYEAHFSLAERLIADGHSIILDSPVFWPNIVSKWRELSAAAGSPLLMIECVCGDEAELRRRLSTRDALESQMTGPLPPRPPGAFEPSCDRLTLDTTRQVADVVADALAYVRAARAIEVPT